MSQTCSKCSHVNPKNAVYCYYDGALLEGHGAAGAPVSPGAMPFPTPFVFASGQECKNFDQLAMGCMQNWSAAVDMLKQGYFGGFFGGLGRMDLAVAAKEAAEFPNPDRGLDQLLAKFPTQVLEPPKLKVDPKEVNLGTLNMGTNKQFEVKLINQGMRLLHGTIVSNSKWLLIGEAPGQPQKLFQFHNESKIPVQILGKQLRAGNKPLVGELGIESNGGQSSIKVKLQVPVKPFQQGPLAGATTPRQIAEKAKANPKESAALFANGTVAKWFKENGWTYPVQGPNASGLGAVQQFFEALGLAKPPKVKIDKQSLMLQGTVGQPVQTTIEVKTDEKRPVYAYAISNEPWVDCSQTSLKGRYAIINVKIPSIPGHLGQNLNAKIRVMANGNQRFTLPLSVAVSGTPAQFAAAAAAPPSFAQPIMAQPAQAAPMQGGGYQQGYPTPQPMAAPTMATPTSPVMAAPPQGGQFGNLGGPPMGQGPGQVMPGTYSRQKKNNPALIHLIPAGLLALALLVTLIRDLFVGPASNTTFDDGTVVAKAPKITIRYDSQSLYRKQFKDEFDRGEITKAQLQSRLQNIDGLGESMQMGVLVVSEGILGKKLTYDKYGRTNSAMVRIDGDPIVFGDQLQGEWSKTPRFINDSKVDTKAYWYVPQRGIEITQTVEREPGTSVHPKGGTNYRYKDTCLIRYEIKNKDTRSHKVGFRFMLDTLIGGNDGVPFNIPGGDEELVRTRMEIKGSKIPDFIMALEKPRKELSKAGTISQVNFTVKEEYQVERPDRIQLTRWPGQPDVSGRIHIYECPMSNMREDSAVVMYWEDETLKPGETRNIGFSYALGYVTTGTGSLGLTVGGNFVVNGKLTVICHVRNPEEGQEVTLDLPSGLELISGNRTKEVSISEGGRSSVSWQVRPRRAGTFTIEATSGDGKVENTITISASTIFD